MDGPRNVEPEMVGKWAVNQAGWIGKIEGIRRLMNGGAMWVGHRIDGGDWESYWPVVLRKEDAEVLDWLCS